MSVHEFTEHRGPNMPQRRDLLRYAAVGGLLGGVRPKARATSGDDVNAPSSTADISGVGRMIKKQRVTNPDKNPNAGPNAIKLSNVSEWLIFAGHAAIGKHGEILFPGDAVAQLRWIYGSLKRTLEQEGYSLANVIQIKMTCVSEVTLKERVQFLTVVRDVFGDVEVPPVGATMSVVHALAYPGMLCEVDIWAAR